MNFKESKASKAGLCVKVEPATSDQLKKDPQFYCQLPRWWKLLQNYFKMRTRLLRRSDVILPPVTPQLPRHVSSENISVCVCAEILGLLSARYESHVLSLCGQKTLPDHLWCTNWPLVQIVGLNKVWFNFFNLRRTRTFNVYFLKRICLLFADVQQLKWTFKCFLAWFLLSVRVLELSHRSENCCLPARANYLQTHLLKLIPSVCLLCCHGLYSPTVLSWL